MADPIVIPGERLGSTGEYSTGPGTYSRQGYIYSSLVGVKKIEKNADGGSRAKIFVQSGDEPKQFVPEKDSAVICQVLSTTPRFSKVAILRVNGIPVTNAFRGMIRKENIRATEIDKVEVYKCFRPGDIVLARVLSLGDAHSYLLTTAENELGVIHATSEAGARMLPKSWCEMYCSKTKAIEHRKVAKAKFLL